MKKKMDESHSLTGLRQQAEARHKKQAAGSAPLSPDQTAGLVHELEVHQIELEMQNDELRQAYAELELSRNRYSDLYDFAPVGYFVFDARGVMLELNLTGAALLGQERAALIKTPFSRFVGEVDQDLFYLHCKQVFETHARQVCELELIRKDGSRFFGLLESEAVAEGKGHTVRCRTAISNITQRRDDERKLEAAHRMLEETVRLRTRELSDMVTRLQKEIDERVEAQRNLQESEAKYRELVQNANSIILRRTAAGTVTFFNEYAQRYFGYREEEILGRNMVGVIVPETVPSGPDPCGPGGAGGEGSGIYQSIESEAILKNGRRVWIAWTNKAIAGQSGHVEILSIGNDITERKHAERQRDKLNETLRCQTQQLRQLNRDIIQTEHRERQRLAQILHDELQQLLVGAKLNVAVVRLKFNDGGLREQLKKIDELLDSSISVSRSLTAELSPPIIQHAGLLPSLKWLGQTIKQKFGLDVVIESDTGIIMGDEECLLFLFEAVRELLFNIVKHAHTNSARILAKTVNDELHIAVTDEGAGFDYDATDNPAVGFGLFNMSERVRLLGGRLEIKSDPGRGTAITLIAPVGQAPPLPGDSAKLASPASKPRRRVQSARASRPAGGIVSLTLHAAGAAGLRVLLADDHKIARKQLRDLLWHEEGITVVAQASDGQKAVDLVGRHQPDVVIMDVSMPVMDGIEATRRIVAKFPNIKVIGYSMHDDEDMAAKMRSAGAVAYLTKSGPYEHLIAAIRACGPVR